MWARLLSSRRWGLVAAAWASTFAAVHVFWALGGALGLAESAGPDLASRRPFLFVVFGLWGVAVLLLVASVLGVLLARARVSGARRGALLLLGGVVAGALLVRAVLIEVLLLAGAFRGSASLSAAERHWTLVLWNPWFFLGGLGFALAVWAARGPTGASGQLGA